MKQREDTPSGGDAFFGGRNQRPSYGKKKQHHSQKPNEGGIGDKKKQERTCWFCGKPGHLKQDCRKRKRTNTGFGPSFSAFMAGKSSLSSDNDGWCADSGAFVHMTRNRKWFSELRSITLTPVNWK